MSRSIEIQFIDGQVIQFECSHLDISFNNDLLNLWYLDDYQVENICSYPLHSVAWIDGICDPS